MILTVTTLLYGAISFGQVSGPIQLDGRAIRDSIDFTTDMEEGTTLIYTIAVNNKGEITSCKLNRTASTQRSARYQITSRNLIEQHLTFEPGTKHPQFHQGTVTITGVGSTTEN